MAASKKRKPTTSKGRSRSQGGVSLSKNLHYFAYAVAAFLILVGQVQVGKGSHALGIFLSLVGVLIVGVTYLGLVDFSQIGSSFFSPAPKPASKKSAPPPATKLIHLKVGKEKVFTTTGFVRLLLILVALYLGIKGQTALADMGQLVSKGLIYYFSGVALFLAALWPWKREGLKLVPLSPRVEWTFFGLIMVLAAFLRIYKLDTIPSGIFFDMGFQGYGALRILHERWFPWELNITENFPSAPVPIYFGALWFLFFKNTQFNLNLFYVTFCLASFPLIYWTFRQLAGPRVALLSLYILAVMRWNMNFARNSFPPSLLPFFMFAGLGLLLYGLRTHKRWPFITAGIVMPIGLYAYQTYVMFTVVVGLCAGYECVTNWKNVKANVRNLIFFSLIFLAIASPFFKAMLSGASGTRINQLSILNRCKQMHSWEPLKVNVAYTALMYNRRGDPNPRHNLQDHRQLDDVTGFLLFFGFFYALFHAYRRKYFYAVVGFLVMALPCLITIDPAHSSRMYCQTPFVAFLAASAIAALWARARALGGKMGEVLFLILMIPPLGLMGRQNFQTYFVEQANNYASWAEFSIAETTLGRKFADYGDKYECYVSPRYYGFYTIDYLDYFFLDHVHRLDLPDSLAALPDAGRGLYFGLEQGRTGVLDTLKAYYPGGEAETLKDPNGNGFLYFYRVPPEVVDKARGLQAKFSDGKEAQAAQFPQGLPPGPYHATFTGDIYLDYTGEYHFNLPARMSWSIGGRPVLNGAPVKLEKGFHPVEISWSALSGPASLVISYDGPSGKNVQLGPKNFLTVGTVRGLKAEYYNGLETKGNPFLVQWDPVLNFVNGNDFPVNGGAFAIHWSGTLKAPKAGKYFFSTRTSGQGGLKIDRRQVIPQGRGQGEVFLTAGVHTVDVYYSKPNGWGADFSFLWLKPGDAAAEVVPNEAFGEVR